jgi:hypothetical protein
MARKNGKTKTHNKTDPKVVTTTPKKESITLLKRRFVEHLAANGGIASAAFESSGLSKRTAYRHFKEDPDFKEAWETAMTTASDELWAEARRRALNGDEVIHIDADGSKRVTIKKSERLLIHLLEKQGDRKWQLLLKDTARAAWEVIGLAGNELLLPPEKIAHIRRRLIEAFNEITIA